MTEYIIYKSGCLPSLTFIMMNFVQLIGCIRTVKKYRYSEYGTKSAYFWLFGLKSAQFRHAFDSGIHITEFFGLIHMCYRVL